MIINQLKINLIPGFLLTAFITLFVFSSADSLAGDGQKWVLIDDFEGVTLSTDWILKDTRNDTDPHIENPQVTEIQSENSNQFLIKKAAPEGVIGNRKALTFKPLPEPVAVGSITTFYAKINVEYFPNNHVFGLSDMNPEDIALHDYNALEPSIRITDKSESDGTKNDGTMMVRTGDTYSKIYNAQQQRTATPMQAGQWYEIWMVVNNSLLQQGGQKYDVYVRGGDEFPVQQMVFRGADFRMKREQPLSYFLANCNTGPSDHPYGNGGLRYDDLYMANGTVLTTPQGVEE